MSRQVYQTLAALHLKDLKCNFAQSECSECVVNYPQLLPEHILANCKIDHVKCFFLLKLNICGSHLELSLTVNEMSCRCTVHSMIPFCEFH